MMKRFKKELSWLLVAALVVSSLVIGLGQLETSAATQATGQMGSYRFRVSTAGQDCNGTGTADALTVYITYTDGSSNNANQIPGEGGGGVANYFEAGATDTIDLSPQLMAKPISSIYWVSGGDRWKCNWAAIDYYNGSAYVEIANMGGFDGGGGTRYFTLSSTNSLNTSSLNKTLTFSYNYTGSPAAIEVYSEQGATLPASNAPTVSRTGYTFAGWSPAVPATGPAANTTYNATWNVNYYTIAWAANGGTGGGSNSCAYGAMPTPISAGTRTGWTFTSYPGVTTCTGPATYTAAWTQNDYTYTFDANGGTGGTSGTLHYGDAVTVPTVSKTGSNFAGWAQGTPPATMPDNNIYYSATWTQNDYTYSFNANGGTGGTSGTLHYGDPVSVPTVSQTGYTFAGWAEGTPPATMPANNIAYTANWNINSYTITWAANGGTGGGFNSCNYGATPTPIDPGTRTGYTFTGNWTPTIATCTGPATYAAVWTQNDYTFTFDANGGTGGTSGTLHYGDAVTVPTVSKTGSTFAGWQQGTPPSTMPANNIYYTATWTANQYTISFNSNGGSAVSSITQAYGTAVTAPADPTRTGYTFTGWTPACPSAMPASDTNCVAGWTANNYNITFDANGGTGGWGPTSMAYGATLTAPTVSKTGYTFNGWDTTVPSTVPAADTTYTAQWVINNYTVSFDANGGSAVSDIMQNYNTQVSAPSDPTKAGNTFVAWYSDAGLTNAVSWPYTLGASNVTFYAKWSVNSYNITWAANGGTGGGSNSCDYGAMPTPIDPGTKTGYTFAGWNPTVVAATADTTYTAQWTIVSFTITWAANGGTGGGSNSCDYGATPTAIDAGTKTGYTFNGWSPTIAAATADATYIAQWKLSQSTITFNSAGGSAVDPITGEVGASVPFVDDPYREGYSFTGWNPGIPATFPESDITVTAQWIINNYTAYFLVNGENYDAISIEYGATVQTPAADPTMTGYTFTGWDSVPATMPAQAIFINALFDIKVITITFDTAGGNAIAPISGDYGTAVTAPADPTQAGYIFASWDPAIPTNYPAEDLTITALWTPAATTPVLVVAPGDPTTVIDDTKKMIYGLEQGISQADFESLFVGIEGNGRLQITPYDEFGQFGTGTKVELIDNATNEVVDSYYVVIFGDLNGDGVASGIDGDIAYNYDNWFIEWDYETQPFLFTAGDLNGDASVTGIDGDIIYNCDNWFMYIDQTTGLAYES